MNSLKRMSTSPTMPEASSSKGVANYANNITSLMSKTMMTKYLNVTTMTSSSKTIMTGYSRMSDSSSLPAMSSMSESQTISSSTINPTMAQSSTLVVESSSVPTTTTTTTTPTTTPSPPPNMISLCNTYNTVIDDTRLNSNLALCDLKYYEAVRFKSSFGQNLQLRENCSAADQLEGIFLTLYLNVEIFSLVIFFKPFLSEIYSI